MDRPAHTRRIWLVIGLTALIASSYVSAEERPNLALHKPASSSSIENDEHSASHANDGKSDTCWRADDEPEGGPEWWLVDLEKPFNLIGGNIIWPYDGMLYRYKVEGSSDRKTWLLLSDQSDNKSKLRSHDLKFKNARGIRFVKVTVVGVEEGLWASISEVQIFGASAD